jgi:hypothetical protein
MIDIINSNVIANIQLAILLYQSNGMSKKEAISTIVDIVIGLLNISNITINPSNGRKSDRIYISSTISIFTIEWTILNNQCYWLHVYTLDRKELCSFTLDVIRYNYLVKRYDTFEAEQAYKNIITTLDSYIDSLL